MKWSSRHRKWLIALLIILLILLPFSSILLAALAPFRSRLKNLFPMKKPAKIKPSDWDALLVYSKRKNIPIDYLAKAISIETAGTFSTTIVNPLSGAVGIFQFLPSTLAGLDAGTFSTSRMTFEGQLNLFDKYLSTLGNPPIRSESDMYFAIFYPAAIGKPDDYVVGMPNVWAVSSIAQQNQAFDENKNGNITVGEVKAYLKKYKVK